MDNDKIFSQKIKFEVPPYTKGDIAKLSTKWVNTVAITNRIIQKPRESLEIYRKYVEARVKKLGEQESEIDDIIDEIKLYMEQQIGNLSVKELDEWQRTLESALNVKSEIEEKRENLIKQLKEFEATIVKLANIIKSSIAEQNRLSEKDGPCL